MPKPDKLKGKSLFKMHKVYQANIIIEELDKYTVSQNGKFEFKNIPVGDYT